MKEISDTITILKAVEIILSLCIIPLTVAVVNLINGMKCQLRSHMLRIYYRYKDSKKIHQYEMENFVYLYNAYKSLLGNSFVDKIHKEVMSWEVVE